MNELKMNFNGCARGDRFSQNLLHHRIPGSRSAAKKFGQISCERAKMKTHLRNDLRDGSGH